MMSTTCVIFQKFHRLWNDREALAVQRHTNHFYCTLVFLCLFFSTDKRDRLAFRRVFRERKGKNAV